MQTRSGTFTALQSETGAGKCAAALLNKELLRFRTENREKIYGFADFVHRSFLMCSAEENERIRMVLLYRFGIMNHEMTMDKAQYGRIIQQQINAPIEQRSSKEYDDDKRADKISMQRNRHLAA